ncbi:hypothetical protein ACSNOJ_31590 [Streptomyces sp. URMC 128]|uniref:hypothetical protein n=1 Tax=Streptomyces sp. URMC 128 TaxID=3423404 RepID=UPI003F1AD87A
MSGLTHRASAVLIRTPVVSSPISPKRALPSPCSLSRYTRYVGVVVVPGRRVRRSTSTRCVGFGSGALSVSVARTVPRSSTPAGAERACTVAVTSYAPPGPGYDCEPGRVPEATVAPSRLAVQVPEVRHANRTDVPGRQVAGADTAITGVPLPAHRLTASVPRRSVAWGRQR